MNEQTVKEVMQQSLDMLEKGGLNCEKEEFVAQSLRKAIKNCEQMENQERLGYVDRCQFERWAILKDTEYESPERCYMAFSTEPFKSGETNCNLPIYITPSNVRRLSEDEIEEIISKYATLNHDNSPINCSIHTWARLHDYTNAIMDACGIKEGKL